MPWLDRGAGNRPSKERAPRGAPPSPSAPPGATSAHFGSGASGAGKRAAQRFIRGDQRNHLVLESGLYLRPTELTEKVWEDTVCPRS